MSIFRDLDISISMEEGIELFFEGDRGVFVVTGINNGLVGKCQQFCFDAFNYFPAVAAWEIGSSDAASEKGVA